MFNPHAPQDSLSHVERYINQVQHDLNLPGLAIGIVHNGNVVFLKGFGKASPDRNVSIETPFVIGSLSKSFTAMALMQLREVGKIDLDAPVQRYIPWFRLADPEATAKITLRRLLTHTSGISRYAGRELLGGRGNKTMEQSVRDLARVKLRKPVGTFQYSNTNYLIAGLVIQVVSGQTYEAYIQEHIFRPLRMQHSFTNEEEAMLRGAAMGYRWWFGVPVPAHVPFLPDALPAAFLWSSARDMATWLQVHLGGGRHQGVQILSEQGIAELHRPTAYIPASGASYGLGWRRWVFDETPVVSHSGEVANFRCEILLLPEWRTGIVVLANCNNGLIADLGLDRIVPGIVRILQGRQPETRTLTFRYLYVVLDLAIGLLSLLSALWTWREIRAKKRSPIGSLLGSLVDLAALIAVITALPRFFDAPWSLLCVYVPDITGWLRFVMLPLSVLRLIARLFNEGREVRIETSQLLGIQKRPELH